MITCEMARDLLLEAEPAELHGVGDGVLATHLRDCAACRRRAAFLLEQTDRLGDRLAALLSSPRQPGSMTGPRRAGNGNTRRWAVLAPLALAAGLAALVLVRRHGITPTGGTPLRVASAAAPDLDVQVPAGRSVAVFQTANPNIVVIWSF